MRYCKIQVLTRSPFHRQHLGILFANRSSFSDQSHHYKSKSCSYQTLYCYVNGKRYITTYKVRPLNIKKCDFHMLQTLQLTLDKSLEILLTRFSTKLDDHINGLILHRRRPRIQKCFVFCRIKFLQVILLGNVDFGVKEQNTSGSLFY